MDAIPANGVDDILRSLDPLLHDQAPFPLAEIIRIGKFLLCGLQGLLQGMDHLSPDAPQAVLPQGLLHQILVPVQDVTSKRCRCHVISAKLKLFILVLMSQLPIRRYPLQSNRLSLD